MLKMNIKRHALAAALLSAAAGLSATPAAACGSDPISGEICTFAGSYCPQGFLPADGRQLQISQFQVLFAVIGIAYGGDGRTYFNLPDLRGRSVVGAGTGNGLTPLKLGQARGRESVDLTLGNIPQQQASVGAQGGSPVPVLSSAPPAQSVATVPPELALTVCIANTGVYPMRPD